jgi:hypothetical protein
VPVGHDSTAWTTALPLAFLMVNVLAFFGWLLADLLMRLIRARHGAAVVLDRGTAPIARSLLRLPSDYGLLALLFVLWATPVYLALYAVLLVANGLILVAALPTWFRQVRHEEEVDG